MTSKRIIATAILTSKINPALTLNLPCGPVQSYYEWLVQNSHPPPAFHSDIMICKSRYVLENATWKLCNDTKMMGRRDPLTIDISVPWHESQPTELLTLCSQMATLTPLESGDPRSALGQVHRFWKCYSWLLRPPLKNFSRIKLSHKWKQVLCETYKMEKIGLVPILYRFLD